MASTYELGQSIELTANFVNSDDTAFDPDSVVCKVIDPTGTVTQPTVSREGVGSYSVIVSIALDAQYAGKWYYRFEGTGANAAVKEAMFIVSSSRFYS